VAAIVLVAGGLLVAGLPPLASFVGWSLVVRSSADVGYGWLPPVLALAAAVTGGTLLRAAARIVLGWGDEEDPLLSHEPPAEEDEPQVPESRLSPPLLFGPALALLIAAIGVGFTPGLGDRATRWAERLEDRPAHAAEVLAGKLPPAVPPAPVHVGIVPYAYSFASLAGAIVFALVGSPGSGCRTSRARGRGGCSNRRSPCSRRCTAASWATTSRGSRSASPRWAASWRSSGAKRFAAQPRLARGRLSRSRHRVDTHACAPGRYRP
jgi:NADH:ubiquinone oxidoreductase subunit 5 (subunit L)/multisubunit Na+/H+ antiporter MnhA subunit